MQRAPLAAVCALGLIAAAPTANAEEFQIRIQYGDLDLNSIDGADALIRRIERSAERACADNAGRLTLQERRAAEECAKDVMQRSLAQLDDPGVNTRFAELREQSALVQIASR